jgi:HAD superfamily hydrolase (TIGR01509 family)
MLDFDGTILDTEGPVYQSWAELWAARGHQLSLAEWQTRIGTDGGFDPWAELERRAGARLDPALDNFRRARRDELQALHQVRPGILAWLEEAAKLGVPVGVASSSSQDWVESHLQRLGVRECFQTLVCAGGAVPAKPDPTCYRIGCEALGADLASSVAVEDSPHGVAAAADAGLYTVAVPHALTVDLDFWRADRVIESLEVMTLAEVISEATQRSISRPNRTSKQRRTHRRPESPT